MSLEFSTNHLHFYVVPPSYFKFSLQDVGNNTFFKIKRSVPRSEKIKKVADEHHALPKASCFMQPINYI